MRMYSMAQYIRSSIVVVLLAIVACIFSAQLYLCMLFMGLFLILLTVWNLSERQSRLILALQLLLSLGFSLLSSHFLPFLIFYECPLFRRRPLQIALPPLIYAAVQAVFRTLALPQVLIRLLILTAVSALLYATEILLQGYLTAGQQAARAISATAVNEMYEKKLNRELVLRNYLSEKNARLAEREDISRRIHNSVGHSVTAAIMTLDAADMLLDSAPEQAREKMNTARSRMQTSLDSIRRAVRVLDDENGFISMPDFISELQLVAEQFVMDTTRRVATDFSEADLTLSLPREYTEFLTGAAQELLTNGVRHGGADYFTILVTADTGHIQITVSDNGTSDFSEDNRRQRIQNGFGLKKLISYANRCGGSAVFTNENGFRSEITLPLYREDKNGNAARITG